MSSTDIVLLIIGVGLIIGTFVSAWMFLKVIKDVEEKDKEKKKNDR